MAMSITYTTTGSTQRWKRSPSHLPQPPSQGEAQSPARPCTRPAHTGHAVSPTSQSSPLGFAENQEQVPLRHQPRSASAPAHSAACLSAPREASGGRGPCRRTARLPGPRGRCSVLLYQTREPFEAHRWPEGWRGGRERTWRRFTPQAAMQSVS